MSAFIKSLKGYRTFIVNGIMLLAALLVGVGVLSPSDAAGVTEQSVGETVDSIVAAVAALAGVLNMILRLFTTGPAGTKA